MKWILITGLLLLTGCAPSNEYCQDNLSILNNTIFGLNQTKYQKVQGLTILAEPMCCYKKGVLNNCIYKREIERLTKLDQ